MDPKYHIERNFLLDPLVLGDISLYQVGRMYCTEKTLVEKHVQCELFELTIITGGKGIVRTNDVPTAVSQGDIYLSFPGDFHEIESDKESPMKFDFISFNTTMEELHDKLKMIENDFIFPTCRVIQDNRISVLCKNALAEVSNKEFLSEEMLRSTLFQLIVYLIRDFSATKANVQPNTSDAELLCLKLMNYIDTHIYTLKNLEHLAEVFNYNYSYLSALFNKITSRTLFEYYQNRRMEAARLLIDEGVFSITQISEMLGYSSIYAFSRAFKLYYGHPPKTYSKK